MPSKRQPAKQRRAAENRAKRAALAARSTAASAPPPKAAATSSRATAAPGSSSTRAAATRTAPAAGLEGGLAGWKEWFGIGRGATRGPGVLALFWALFFGALAAVVVPFVPLAQVDDRGEPLPAVGFSGLYLEARSLMTGQTVEAESASAVNVNGPVVVLLFAVPLLVVIGATVSFRRSGRSTPLTIGMIALALIVLLPVALGPMGQFYLPSMIALAFASFQVRRLEMADRMASQKEQKEQRPRAATSKAHDDDVAEPIEADVIDDEDYDDTEDYDDLDADEEYDDLEEDDDTDVEPTDEDESSRGRLRRR